MDEVVFQRFVDGDDAAFTFIYNKYVDLLLQYGRSLGFEKRPHPLFLLFFDKFKI